MMRARQQVAAELRAYLAGDDGDAASALVRAAGLCTTISWLVHELVQAEDARVSIDGLTPVALEYGRAGSLTVSGCVVANAQALRPVRAELALWPARSTIRLGGDDSERPWTASAVDRVLQPASWPCVFAFRLPASLTERQIAAWSTVAFVELRQLLFWRWDPIGVEDAFPRTSDEYDEYARVLLARIRRGESAQELARYLRDVETELVGERLSDWTTLEQFASRLIDWYEDSTGYWLERRSSAS